MQMGSVLTTKLDIEDSEIVLRGRTTDHDGLELLYTVYAEGLTKYCRTRLNGREADAEDAAHETLLRASRALRRFREGAPLWPWLATIAANVCKDMVRNDNRFDELDADAADPHSVTEDEVDRRDRAAIVVAAMGAIPEHYRKALYLREFESWSWEDIARVEGKSVASVRSSLMRGRRFLRQSIRHEAERVNQWPLPTVTPRSWTGRWVSIRDRFQEWYSAPERAMAVLPASVSVAGVLAALAEVGPVLANASVAAVMAIAALHGPAAPAPAPAPIPPVAPDGPVISVPAKVDVDRAFNAAIQATVGKTPAPYWDWWENDPPPLVSVPVGNGNVRVLYRPFWWPGDPGDGNGPGYYSTPALAVFVDPPPETGLPKKSVLGGGAYSLDCRQSAQSRNQQPIATECAVLEQTPTPPVG
jgi:RNA polymerase sigma-70 factor (ECF subfamily)